MANLNIEVPDNLSVREQQQIQEFFKTRTKTDWMIFKENFNAFISSLKKVCANFWHKICDWAAGLWEKIRNIF